MQEPYLQANQQLWNDWTQLHQDTPFYPIAAVKAGGSSLRPVERAELLPQRGRSEADLGEAEGRVPEGPVAHAQAWRASTGVPSR